MSWRAIQDSVAASQTLAAVSHGAERLYWRLLAETDSYGRLRGEPSKVRATCMPLLRVHDGEIDEWLAELEEVDRIVRYTIDGRDYIQITEFELNQPTEFLRRRGKERIPPPPKRASFAGNSRTTPDQSGVEEKRREEKQKNNNSSSSTSPQDQEPAAAETDLEALGWRHWQIVKATHDPDRARAWVEAAKTRANGNPGGYAWSGFNSGDWPQGTGGEMKDKINVVDACQNFIEGMGWDETFDEEAMTYEFGRISRSGRTEGELTAGELAGLIEQWKATRQDRYGIKANLTA